MEDEGGAGWGGRRGGAGSNAAASIVESVMLMEALELISVLFLSVWSFLPLVFFVLVPEAILITFTACQNPSNA